MARKRENQAKASENVRLFESRFHGLGLFLDGADLLADLRLQEQQLSQQFTFLLVLVLRQVSAFV